MHIAICIATFQRPKLLRSLLSGLSASTFTRVVEPRIDVVVADNDASGSAEKVCREGMTRWPLIYRIESRRGIAQARNCAVGEAKGADFVVFIDDDETPDACWLEELLLAQSRYSADIVSGPVMPSFASDVPNWIQQGRFFDSPNYATGREIEWCATNNALVANVAFERLGGFDERFQLSGADDLHFFRRAFGAGLKIVWSQEAIVSESIARDRANIHWLLRRSYRAGNSFVLVESALDHRILTRFVRFAKACVKIVHGIVETAVAIFRGKTQMTHSLRRVCMGAGMLTALADLKYQSYRTVTGE